MVDRKARRQGGRAKEDTVRRHARERGRERYGIEMGPAVEDEIVRKIAGGKSICVERQSLRVSVHDVPLEGLTVRVVYDKQRRQVVTFLPREPVATESRP